MELAAQEVRQEEHGEQEGRPVHPVVAVQRVAGGPLGGNQEETRLVRAEMRAEEGQPDQDSGQRQPENHVPTRFPRHGCSGGGHVIS